MKSEYGIDTFHFTFTFHSFLCINFSDEHIINNQYIIIIKNIINTLCVMIVFVALPVF